MTLQKSTRIDTKTRQRVHTWVDAAEDFYAEVRRDHDGWWIATTVRADCTVHDYRSAVDFVMDEYRLAKSGFISWEEAAAQMAEGPWEELSDEERQDLINSARQMARSV